MGMGQRRPSARRAAADVRRRALRALLAAALPGLLGCYAKSFPLAPAPAPPTRAATPLPLTAGVRAGASGENVVRIHATDVLARFAGRLDGEGLFRDIVFPYTGLARVEPDLLLELSVASELDLHPIQNLLKDLVVGVSVLLLQPAVPTAYDLDVELTLRVRSARGDLIAQLQQTSRFRYETTWLHPPADSLDAWHREATDHAVEALIARLVAERGSLAPNRGAPRRGRYR